MKVSASEIICPRYDSFANNCRQHDAAAVEPGAAITWALVPDRGRGVLACTDVNAGAVLNVAPAVAVEFGEHDQLMRQYVFMCRRDECEPPYAGPSKQALVFGLMALCNHSDDPNASVCFHQSAERGLKARLTARRAIAKGEEVTISYTDCTWYKETGLF